MNYRRDITDETEAPPGFWQNQPDTYLYTYANVAKAGATAGLNFFVNHRLHDALVDSRSPRQYAESKLEQAFGLGDVFADPLVIGLMAKPTSVDSPPTLDASKVQQMHDFSHPKWRLEVCDANLGGTPCLRYQLSGKMFALGEKQNPTAKLSQSLVAVTYWITEMAGRTVCLMSVYTNLAQQSSVISERKEFDGNGRPHFWRKAHFKGGELEKETIVHFKEIDLIGNFRDEVIFAASFPSNYTVADVSSGKASLLQTSHPKIPIANSQDSSRVRRTLILLFLATSGLLALVIIRWVRGKQSPQS